MRPHCHAILGPPPQRLGFRRSWQESNQILQQVPLCLKRCMKTLFMRLVSFWFPFKTFTKALPHSWAKDETADRKQTPPHPSRLNRASHVGDSPSLQETMRPPSRRDTRSGASARPCCPWTPSAATRLLTLLAKKHTTNTVFGRCCGRQVSQDGRPFHRGRNVPKTCSTRKSQQLYMQCILQTRRRERHACARRAQGICMFIRTFCAIRAFVFVW